MHTFSLLRCVHYGLQILRKPLLHLHHTQYNKQIPWDTMDMDFMEPEPKVLTGDHEYGHILSRLHQTTQDRHRILGMKDTGSHRRLVMFVPLGLMLRIYLSSASVIR